VSTSLGSSSSGSRESAVTIGRAGAPRPARKTVPVRNIGGSCPSPGERVQRDRRGGQTERPRSARTWRCVRDADGGAATMPIAAGADRTGEPGDHLAGCAIRSLVTSTIRMRADAHADGGASDTSAPSIPVAADRYQDHPDRVVRPAAASGPTTHRSAAATARPLCGESSVIVRCRRSCAAAPVGHGDILPAPAERAVTRPHRGTRRATASAGK
jgi:hypothetical protein